MFMTSIFIFKKRLFFVSSFEIVWWSRRSEKTAQDCDFEFKNQDNPSLAAKICGKIVFE